MKEKLVNNQSLKLISVVFAFVIWIAVVNVSNPEVTRSKTVPLTVIHGEVLTTAGKTYTVQNGESVTVSYQVRARDAYRIDADNFKATIDLENLYDVTGSVPVSVEVVGNRDLINASPVARPGVIRVLTEDIQNKSFPLTTHPVGEPAENFEVGSMTLKPETVMVSGPVSEVGRISSVGVKVNVSGASEDLSGTAPVTYFDANGNEIQMEDDRMKSEPGDISYYVDMLRGKSLPLRLNVGGEAAHGYRFTGTECSVKSVSAGRARTVGGTAGDCGAGYRSECGRCQCRQECYGGFESVSAPGRFRERFPHGDGDHEGGSGEHDGLPGITCPGNRTEKPAGGLSLQADAHRDFCRAERTSGDASLHYGE